ncbi:uncharacterized protein LAJ45_01512 [Morchella importuna]|nr:uncharacterized protein LAJ45_01512 [Morchella importuna]KAH8154979.1 hypothetical protein LAJ45_01512 [Morchella importuna]
MAVDTIICLRTRLRLTGRTILHWASARGRKSLILKLLAQGAKIHVNRTDEDGMTALHSATLLGNWDIVKLLLENGADIEARNAEGWTPLLCASITGDHQTASILLEKGADIATRCLKYPRWTALYYAAALGRFEVVDLLIKRGSSIEATEMSRVISNAVVAGEKRTVQLLLSHAKYDTVPKVTWPEHDLSNMLSSMAKSDMLYRSYFEHGLVEILFEAFT